MITENQTTSGTQTPESHRFVSMALRLQLVREIAEQVGMPKDGNLTPEEARRQVREATRRLHERATDSTSRDIIAMRDE